MLIDFTNKTILITAGSKGIGFELAKQFLLNNANVCICSRNKKHLNQAKKNLSKITNQSKFLVVKHDISKINNQFSIFKSIKKKFGKDVDILINNSGGPPPKEISETNLKDWDLALKTNLMSAITLSQEVIKQMKKKNGEE